MQALSLLALIASIVCVCGAILIRIVHDMANPKKTKVVTEHE